ncbi:MAG: PilT/PilU family type 4a pilus ATPase [bacterium]|nr:PilT/PilU family type 4a pilus ATPase [bacterium]
MDRLLAALVERQASDLHLKPMRPPIMRVNGKLTELGEGPLSIEMMDDMVDAILPEHLRERMGREMAVDFGYGVKGVSRFRASVYCQRGTRAAVFRRVPFDFPSLEEWGLPDVLNDLCNLTQGLVLITGPTGSGKSSTLAAMMKRIATTRQDHIVTIEDPIEFLISDDMSSISQREIGIDTPDFAIALRSILRQDPDVIMVGEMRDEETIKTVLAAAETGHLVFSTLHTNSAHQTIDRILSGFSGSSHRQVCQQLSSGLEAVVSMQLVPRADGDGMVAAVEILRRSPQIAKLILNSEFGSLYEEIESSVSYYSMQSMNQSLASLLIHGTITLETARASSSDAGALDLLLCKVVGASDRSHHGDEMSEPTADFSKILKLQEIGRQYEELQARHTDEITMRDREIEQLRAELTRLSDRSTEQGRISELEQENSRLQGQMQTVRDELDGQIERLNTRVRDLTSKAAQTTDTGRKGLFRR